MGKCGSHHNPPTLLAGAGVAMTPGAGPAAPPGAAPAGPEAGTAPDAVGIFPKSDSTMTGGGGPGGPGAPPLGALGILLDVVTGTTFG